jgi:hypothetical protein
MRVVRAAQPFAERAESAMQVKDIEDRLREYEDALDELVLY